MAEIVVSVDGNSDSFTQDPLTTAVDDHHWLGSWQVAARLENYKVTL